MKLHDAIKRKIRARTIRELKKRLPDIVSSFVGDLKNSDNSVILNFLNSGLEVDLKKMLIKCLSVVVKIVRECHKNN
jgi:hypothetical protein